MTKAKAKGAGEVPPPDALTKLLETLAEAKARQDAGEDALACCNAALSAAITFIALFSDVEERDLLTPLNKLMLALWDTLEGAKPALLFKREISANHRPAGTSFDIARAGVAVAVEILVRAGIPLKEACKKVAGFCDEAAIRQPNEKRINAATARAWRDRSTDKSDQIYAFRKEFFEEKLTQLNLTRDRADAAEEIARVCIENIRRSGI